MAAIPAPTRAYSVLFGILIVYFASVPLVQENTLIDIVLDLTLVGALLNALRAVAHDGRLVAVATLFGIAMLSEPVLSFFDVPLLLAISVPTVSMIVFLLIVTLPLALDVYRASIVSFRTILGACSMYLLLGYIWFGVFTLIEIVEPDSFAYAETHSSDVWDGSDDERRYGRSVIARDQIFYFTMVTITTLGFGDVAPVSSTARTYTTLAAITGQLFLAIMIARLVGMHSAHHAARDDPDPQRH